MRGFVTVNVTDGDGLILDSFKRRVSGGALVYIGHNGIEYHMLPGDTLNVRRSSFTNKFDVREFNALGRFLNRFFDWI